MEEAGNAQGSTSRSLPDLPSCVPSNEDSPSAQGAKGLIPAWGESSFAFRGAGSAGPSSPLPHKEARGSSSAGPSRGEELDKLVQSEASTGGRCQVSEEDWRRGEGSVKIVGGRGSVVEYVALPNQPTVSAAARLSIQDSDNESNGNEKDEPSPPIKSKGPSMLPGFPPGGFEVDPGNLAMATEVLEADVVPLPPILPEGPLTVALGMRASSMKEARKQEEAPPRREDHYVPQSVSQRYSLEPADTARVSAVSLASIDHHQRPPSHEHHRSSNSTSQRSSHDQSYPVPMHPHHHPILPPHHRPNHHSIRSTTGSLTPLHHLSTRLSACSTGYGTPQHPHSMLPHAMGDPFSALAMQTPDWSRVRSSIQSTKAKSTFLNILLGTKPKNNEDLEAKQRHSHEVGSPAGLHQTLHLPVGRESRLSVASSSGGYAHEEASGHSHPHATAHRALDHHRASVNSLTNPVFRRLSAAIGNVHGHSQLHYASQIGDHVQPPHSHHANLANHPPMNHIPTSGSPGGAHVHPHGAGYDTHPHEMEEHLLWESKDHSRAILTGPSTGSPVRGHHHVIRTPSPALGEFHTSASPYILHSRRGSINSDHHSVGPRSRRGSYIDKLLGHDDSALPNKLPDVPIQGQNLIEKSGNTMNARPTFYGNAPRGHQWSPWKLQRAFDPDGTARCRWDLLTIICVIYTVAMAPLRVSFGNHNMGIIACIDFTVDFLCIVDIFLNFHTGYYNSDDDLVLDLKEVRRKYFRTYFWEDFVASLPWDVFLLIHTSHMANLLLRLPKLLHLLRIPRMLRAMNKWKDFIGVNERRYALVRLFLLIAVWAHLNACMQFFVSRVMHHPPDGWVAQSDILGSSKFHQYTHCIFTSISHMMSIAYGTEFTVKSTSDMWAFMVSISGGSAFFFSTVGVVAHAFKKDRTMEKIAMIELMQTIYTTSEETFLLLQHQAGSMMMETPSRGAYSRKSSLGDPPLHMPVHDHPDEAYSSHWGGGHMAAGHAVPHDTCHIPHATSRMPSHLPHAAPAVLKRMPSQFQEDVAG